jgi:hypothetical protein
VAETWQATSPATTAARAELTELRLSDFCDVRRLGALLAFGDLEFHLIAFLQALIAFGAYRAVMHEDICSIVTADEPVSFRVVKPFHCALQSFHLGPPSFARLSWGFKDVLAPIDAICKRRVKLARKAEAKEIGGT